MQAKAAVLVAGAQLKAAIKGCTSAPQMQTQAGKKVLHSLAHVQGSKSARTRDQDSECRRERASLAQEKQGSGAFSAVDCRKSPPVAMAACVWQ